MNFRSYDTINSAMTTTPVTNQFQHMQKSILSPESGNLQGCTDFVHSQMMYCSPFHARHIKRIGMERVSTICHSWKVIVFTKGVICGNAKAITLLLHMWVTRYTVWGEYFKCRNGLLGVGRNIDMQSSCYHKTLTIWGLQAMVYTNPMLISTVQYLNKLTFPSFKLLNADSTLKRWRNILTIIFCHDSILSMGALYWP